MPSIPCSVQQVQPFQTLVLQTKQFIFCFRDIRHIRDRGGGSTRRTLRTSDGHSTNMAALPGGANSNHGIGNPADDDAAAWGFTPGGREGGSEIDHTTVLPPAAVPEHEPAGREGGPTLGGDDRHVAGRPGISGLRCNVSEAQEPGGTLERTSCRLLRQGQSSLLLCQEQDISGVR